MESFVTEALETKYKSPLADAAYVLPVSTADCAAF